MINECTHINFWRIGDYVFYQRYIFVTFTLCREDNFWKH